VTEYLRDGQNVLLETVTNRSAPIAAITQRQFTDYPGAWGGLVLMREASDAVLHKIASSGARVNPFLDVRELLYIPLRDYR
jgi:hypothetical protein